uniref:Uncharacterized protein n=1 Tax=viral metagenome TaxID=1070528 RepID=A0A6C0F471_9ZZZZ
MDINQYQKDRARELNVFQKDYTQLKTQYTSRLTQAVHETDSTKQAELVKQVLSINSELAQHVREFLQSSKGKFDPALISELTADIIRYQKEFEAIEKSSDKAKALKSVLYKQEEELSILHKSFNIYLGIFLGLIAVVLLLIFRTSITQMTQAVVETASSTSTTDMGYLPESFPGNDGQLTSPL